MTKTRIATAVAVLIGTIAFLPATAAQAAHHIGGYTVGCFYPASASYDGAQAAVDGLGSEQPRNALVAGRGRVSSSPTCARSRGIKVLRVQIDAVALRTTRTIAAKRFVDNGTAYVSADTPGVANLPCSTALRVEMRFSVRYADGSLGGSTLIGPYFHRC